MEGDGIADWFRDLNDSARQTLVARLSEEERQDFRWNWNLWARQEQLPPSGDWHIWLICAGRGFGKTRAGAEWVRSVAWQNSGARIALIGASLAEVRAVMVEGESGILAISPPHRRPQFEPSLRQLRWENGARATLYSAADPESLRGPQHSHAWCDEIGKWDNASDRAIRTWDNLLMGLRLGERPRALATTTPRAVPLIQRLMRGETQGHVAVSRGSMFQNGSHLPPQFIIEMNRQFGGTALGRQELNGELLTEVDGALWTRSLIETCRETGVPGAMTRIVIGVDPPASAHGDACGIVVAGLAEAGHGVVLADCSVEKPSPEKWARAVANAAEIWSADRVVAEANQGGAMVGSVLRAANIALPIKLVHASKGKIARAEPVAALYETSRVRHAEAFAKLEDEMCGLMAGGTYEGPGRSPDRADALVWALSELMLGRRNIPRVHTDL